MIPALKNYDCMSCYSEMGEYNGYHYELSLFNDGYCRLIRRKLIETIGGEESPRTEYDLGEIEICREGFGKFGNINEEMERFFDIENERKAKTAEFFNKGLK